MYLHFRQKNSNYCFIIFYILFCVYGRVGKVGAVRGKTNLTCYISQRVNFLQGSKLCKDLKIKELLLS